MEIRIGSIIGDETGDDYLVKEMSIKENKTILHTVYIGNNTDKHLANFVYLEDNNFLDMHSDEECVLRSKRLGW